MQNSQGLFNYQPNTYNLFIYQKNGVKTLKKAEYRNAARSRRLIRDALLELLDEKPLEKITVTDITKRADVNRGTFYLHYNSVNEVISELQDAYIAQMDQYFEDLKIPITVDNIMIITTECMKSIYEQNQAKYMALIFHQQITFADKVCRHFQNRLLECKDIPDDEDTQKEIIVRSSLLAHGILGVFHASSSGMLDLSTDHLIRGVNNLVADLQYLQTQKRKKEAK